MTDREAIIDVMDGYSVEFFCKVDKNDCADEIIEMLKARGWMNDPVVVELGEQVKKLRKTCPNVELAKIMDWPYDERCSACNGTGYLPIGLGGYRFNPDGEGFG